MPRQSQTYANHRRYLPIFHFVASPILCINLGVALVRAVRSPTVDSGWNVVVAAGLVALLLSARAMALSVQNRVIRLEERLRLARVLPERDQALIDQIPTRQLIALRFASDEELPALARRCAAGELQKPEDVKREISNWRPDYLRA